MNFRQITKIDVLVCACVCVCVVVAQSPCHKQDACLTSAWRKIHFRTVFNQLKRFPPAACVCCVCVCCVCCVCVCCVCVCVIYIYKLNILSAHTISCHARRLYEKRLEEGKVNKRKPKDEIVATSDEDDPPEDKPPAKRIKPVKYPPRACGRGGGGKSSCRGAGSTGAKWRRWCGSGGPGFLSPQEDGPGNEDHQQDVGGGGSWHHLQRQALGVFLLLFVVLRSGSPPHAHQSLKAAPFFFFNYTYVLFLCLRFIDVTSFVTMYSIK